MMKNKVRKNHADTTIRTAIPFVRSTRVNEGIGKRSWVERVRLGLRLSVGLVAFAAWAIAIMEACAS